MDADANQKTPGPEASSRVCATHSLQLAPDGKCTLCRRAEYAKAEAEGQSFASKILPLVGLIIAAIAIVYFARQAPPPREKPTSTTAAELEIVNAAIDELEHERAQGRLHGNAANHLEQLKMRRKLLEMHWKASQD